MLGPPGAGRSRRKPPPPRLKPPPPGRPPPPRKSRRGGRLLCTSSLKDSLPLQQAARRLARLCALLQPLLYFCHVDLDLHRVGHRVVVPEMLDKAAVARRARVRHHEAVKGVFLRPHPPQPDLYQLLLLLSIRSVRDAGYRPACLSDSPRRTASPSSA